MIHSPGRKEGRKKRETEGKEGRLLKEEEEES